MRSLLDAINRFFHIITDWILIVSGMLLILVAFRGIDVPVARYSIVGVGVLLIIAGYWFRRCRLKRK